MPMPDHSRLLTVFAEEAIARLLTDYLVSQGIAVELVSVPDPNPFQVFVLDPQHWERAVEIKNQFLANPGDRRYQANAWETGHQLSQPLSFSKGFANWLPLIRNFPVTIFPIIASLLVYLALNIQGMPVFQAFQFQPWEQLVASGQWWRLWTPAILHFSVIHIVFNLLWWWVLGRVLENRFGHMFLILFFMMTALVSNYAQYLMAGSGFGGLSGVVYALFGFVWWIGWLKPQWGIRLPNSLIGFMLIWLVLGYVDVLWVSMANTAHTVGLVSGCAIALLMSQANLIGRPENKEN